MLKSTSGQVLALAAILSAFVLSSLAHAAGDAAAMPKPVGVFVSKERVIQAARAGIRPGGAPVAATWWRPAGVALSGVGYLGVGLKEAEGGAQIIGVAKGSPAEKAGLKVEDVVTHIGTRKIVRKRLQASMQVPRMHE